MPWKQKQQPQHFLPLQRCGFRQSFQLLMRFSTGGRGLCQEGPGWELFDQKVCRKAPTSFGPSPLSVWNNRANVTFLKVLGVVSRLLLCQEFVCGKSARSYRANLSEICSLPKETSPRGACTGCGRRGGQHAAPLLLLPEQRLG